MCVKIGEKHLALSPKYNVGMSHVVTSFDRFPNIDGSLEGFDKGKTSAFYRKKKCHAPSPVSVLSTGIVMINCLKCSQLLFP